ncbi:hypothetical protein PHMEG_00010378 [Phytophthora megakarya]|uniref:Uncharacterized protein n=1 Tax=Phytophthora megakarya TaxID=4795 RepID=A0A225WFW4_9STRA|nr:hypothetical protein PHMEG_00010378 [Phytophthora megakarya]
MEAVVALETLGVDLLRTNTHKKATLLEWSMLMRHIICGIEEKTGLPMPAIYDEAQAVELFNTGYQTQSDHVINRRRPEHTNSQVRSICPILALAIYWATTMFDADENRLFPGSGQYDRFRKCLQRLLVDVVVAAELRRREVISNGLGTHSMRKEAATYCASGSTACPSSTASLGGVHNTYLRYGSAGDMHVGRTVAGLPSGSYEFAICHHISNNKIHGYTVELR